ncbi:hypothetical protein [Dyadobacter sp. NIV53]|uniref:hypothetical protein n=1 Tax=Dyadobacter sp. NIV53 TaxID=2861765 RepID=UPI001C88D78D|nr:hypothetical protein [Dyadobacter sp. NIV53]
MKRLFFLFTILGTLLACSKKETSPEGLTTKFNSEKFPQKWQLVSMTGNVANIPPQTGSDMSWQEFYLFNADGTFSKTRERDGVTKTITGKFSFKNIGQENYMELTYDEDSELIGNCYATATEELIIKSDIQLANTWNACDGPGLMYNKVE